MTVGTKQEEPSHQHEHDFPWAGTQPHAHPHRHAVMTHKRAHFPDIHHRHTH